MKLNFDDEDNYIELKELGQLSEEDKKEQVVKRNQTTDYFINLLTGAFENYDSLNEELVQRIIDEYEDEKIQKLKKENLEAYNTLNETNNKYSLTDYDNFVYFEYEDFLIIFLRVIKYYSNLNIKIDFTDMVGQITISFFADEQNLSILAEKDEYVLRLKNYALKFEKIIEKYEKTHPGAVKEGLGAGQEFLLDVNNNPQDIKLLNNNVREDGGDAQEPFTFNEKGEYIAKKYGEIHLKNVMDFCPHMKYSSNKDDKYQRYETNDDYHDCDMTREFSETCSHGCSKFRNIDKLRIINDIIEKIVKIKFIKAKDILKYILIKRNYKDYGDKLETKNIVLRSWNVFNKSRTMEYLYIIRNFYGEKISYYFLWLTSYIKWLIFPALVGLLFNFFYRFLNFDDGSHNPVWPLLLSAIFIFWGSLFLFQWRQNETLYNYIWGCENYRISEPDRENFVPDKNIVLLLDKELPYVSKPKKFLKSCLSYTVLFGMMIIVFVFVNILFYCKGLLVKKYPDHTLPIGVLIGILNTVQINFMSSFYQDIAMYFNELENHRKEYEALNALAIKYIVYDFINCYYSIFFIGIIKKSTIFGKKSQKCIGFDGKDSCTEEIGIQLYTILFIRFIFNFWEVGKPILSQSAKLVKLGQSMKILDGSIQPHSIEHQMICQGYSMTIGEYSEMIINFGFVILFGSIAPLVAVYVLLLAYMEKFFDCYKIFFLVRVQILNLCGGIEIFNDIMKVFIYIGLFTNAGFTIFADNNFLPEESITTKVILYAVFVFVLFLGIVLTEWNILPPWFDYLQDIKKLYYTQYFLRDSEYLPHKRIIKGLSN